MEVYLACFYLLLLGARGTEGREKKSWGMGRALTFIQIVDLIALLIHVCHHRRKTVSQVQEDLKRVSVFAGWAPKSKKKPDTSPSHSPQQILDWSLVFLAPSSPSSYTPTFNALHDISNCRTSRPFGDFWIRLKSVHLRDKKHLLKCSVLILESFSARTVTMPEWIVFLFWNPLYDSF